MDMPSQDAVTDSDDAALPLACPVCASTRLRDWGRRNAIDLYHCRDCSHRFADVRDHSVLADDSDEFRSRFTHDLMATDQQYYDHLCLGEAEWKPTWLSTRLVLKACTARAWSPASRWLDIGCGSGYLVQQVEQTGMQAIGIEPGGWGQIAAQDKHITVVQGFLQEDTFSEPFDFISAMDVVEHQSDPYPILRTIRGLLSPTGIACITVPITDSFQGRVLKTRWNMVQPPTHSQFFTRRSFERMLSNSGFRVLSLHKYTSSYPSVARRHAAARVMADVLLKLVAGNDQALFVITPEAR